MAATGNIPGEKILIVDDDPSIGSLIADFLRKNGYNAVISTHPQDALNMVKNENFSLAFLDINLPEMNGLDLASRLKKLRPLCEVVFITGHGSFDNAVQAIKIGAYDYLRKPFGINELQLCLKRFQERRELRDKIKLAEQRYFHIVQNIPSLVFIIRKNLELEFINSACESMLGYTPEEAIMNPQWIQERLHPDDIQRVKRLFFSAFQSPNSSFSAECRLVHKEGHTLHVMIGSISLGGREQSQGVESVQGMIVDITDRVFLEKAVIQREKLKLLSSISAEVAHGIRNPLVSIGGFARRLRKRFQELPEGDIILKESERLEKMLRRIAEYLKPVEVNYQDCSINNMVNDCAGRLASEMEKNKVKCRIRLEPSLSIISADKEILSQIFIDLIRNAEREMDKGGEINISTFESDNNYHVEFKNICKSAKKREPEPFFLPFSSSDLEIGLPLSYRLLKNMGGLLSYSQREKEMIFTVSIPKKPTPASEMDGVILQ